MKASREYNLPAAIYRVGSVLGDSTTGASFQLDGPIFTAFENFEKLGAVPKHMCEMNQPFVTVDFSAKAIAGSAIAPVDQGQVAYYHVLNGQEYSGGRLIEVFEGVTGRGFEIMDSDEWWNLLDHSLPADLKAANLPPLPPSAAKLPGGMANVDFLALSTAFMPRGKIERERMLHWFGRGFSTVQLQDRLRRVAAQSPTPEVYNSLIDQLTQPSTTPVDQALAVSLKWGMQEMKRKKMASAKASTSSATNVITPVNAKSVATRYSGNSNAVVAKGGNALTSWLWSTPALAFFSVFLWILMGE